MAFIPENPDARLTRRALSAALTEAGYPIAEDTLATRASRPGRHGGPPYQIFSGRALYRWADALEWAQAATSAPRRNTSEATLATAA